MSSIHELELLRSIVAAYDRGIAALEAGNENVLNDFIDERQELLEIVTQIAREGWTVEPSEEVTLLCEDVIEREGRFVSSLRAAMRRIGNELARRRAQRGQLAKYGVK